MKLEGFDQPFTKIAPYYDRLMSFVNYRSWVSYIERIILMHKIKEKVILDIACGTGVCLEMWFEKGYRVIGLDASEAMLEICRGRFSEVSFKNGEVQLIQGDLRNFFLNAQVPVVTCLYDSLNYLLGEDELLSCFNAVYTNLTRKGIFVFDMNTIHALQDEWGNQIFERRDGPIHSIWDNTFDSTTHVSTLKLTINVYEDSKVVTFKEIHQEKAYALDVIKKISNDAGFDITLYRHLTFNPATELDTRILGIAVKP
ncbi:MAG: class I SAM-dependent methyltransferase [candidate division WOR-3 bacterium]